MGLHFRSARNFAAIAALTCAWSAGATPPRAEALSCAFTPQEELRREAVVIFEGVALSGPSGANELASPARFHVLHYLKGRGPEVVEVATLDPQVQTGEWTGIGASIGGYPHMAPGQRWRIFGTVPKRAGDSARLGVDPDIPCRGSRELGTRSALERGPRTSALAPDGQTRMRAEVLRGPGRLRCLRLWVREAPGGLGRRTECDELDPGEAQLAALYANGLVPGRGLAFAVAGPGLTGFELHSPAGSQFKDVGDKRIGVVTLPPDHDPDSIRVVAHFRNGTQRVLGNAPWRAVGAGPEGGPHAEEHWEAVAELAHPPGDPGTCVSWGPAGRGSFTWDWGECRDLSRSPLFYAVRGFRSYDEEFDYPEGRLTYTAIFGAGGPDVASVTVDGPDGERVLELSEEGRAFITVYGPDVGPADLTLRAVRIDGTALSFEGAAEANLLPAKPAWRP